MRSKPEPNLHADRLAARIRWVVLAAGALMTLPQTPNPLIVVGLALLAGANFAACRWGLEASAYNRFGRRALQAIRLAEVVGGASLCASPLLAGDSLWLFAVPSILVEPLVNRRVRAAAGLALVGIATLGACKWLGKMPTSEFIVSSSAYASTAMLGLVLAFYKVREEVLHLHDNRLDTVLECATTFATGRDLKATILHTLRAGVKELDALAGYVMLADEKGTDTLQAEAAYSPEGEFAFPATIQVGLGITGYAAQMGQPIVIQNGLDEQLKAEGLSVHAKAAVSIPLVARSHWNYGQNPIEFALGAMTLIGRTEHSFAAAEDMQLLRSLAALIASSVANSRMEMQQRSTFLKTLESLAKSLEARDNYTRGHSQRASEVSIMIGELLGFSSEALEELRIGTILHDIGKIGVPDSILHKPGRLDDAEFQTMRQHPVIGYEICKPLIMSEGVLLIIRNHHEKLDGSGYPDGLKGGELPLSLRIVCVADAFDAMSSRRPYRGVMDLNHVLAELSRGAGVQFDPVVVEALRELLPTDRLQGCYREQWDLSNKEAA